MHTYTKRELRRICRHIQQETKKKWPGHESVAIGAFIFLRIFNPAIAVPESYGLLKRNIFISVVYFIILVPPSPSFRRELTLVSKVLQALANQVLFTRKELFMEPLNSFIQENKNAIDKFYADLVVTFPLL